MCGVAGFIDFLGSVSAPDLVRRARVMSDAIANRGPDGSGVWQDADAGVALAQRRLAIIDRRRHRGVAGISGLRLQGHVGY